MNKEKIREISKIIFGLILLPLMFIIYMTDRIIMSLYFWAPIDEWKNWLYYNPKVFKSVIRLTVYLAIYGLIELIF
jgi:hypothetical protein